MKNSNVADLFSNPPPPGKTVEVDAYFSGPLSKIIKGPPPSPGETRICPVMIWTQTLTDQPFRGTLSVLNSTRNNLLSKDIPWLVATVPPEMRLGIGPLPYHARFRGHLGDPRVAECFERDRIFLVEQIVKTHEKVPQSESRSFTLRKDYSQWPRYSDPNLGYSLPYPPDWTVKSPKNATAIAFYSPQNPEHPVIVEVLSESARQTKYPNLVKATANVMAFEQRPYFNDEGNQSLLGETLEEDHGETERVQIVLFSTPERTFELRLRYPLGFAASQQLLAQYTAMVSGFRLDNPHSNIPLIIQPSGPPAQPPRRL